MVDQGIDIFFDLLAVLGVQFVGAVHFTGADVLGYCFRSVHGGLFYISFRLRVTIRGTLPGEAERDNYL